MVNLSHHLRIVSLLLVICDTPMITLLNALVANFDIETF